MFHTIGVRNITSAINNLAFRGLTSNLREGALRVGSAELLNNSKTLLNPLETKFLLGGKRNFISMSNLNNLYFKSSVNTSSTLNNLFTSNQQGNLSGKRNFISMSNLVSGEFNHSKNTDIITTVSTSGRFKNIPIFSLLPIYQYVNRNDDDDDDDTKQYKKDKIYMKVESIIEDVSASALDIYYKYPSIILYGALGSIISCIIGMGTLIGIFNIIFRGVIIGGILYLFNKYKTEDKENYLLYL